MRRCSRLAYFVARVLFGVACAGGTTTVGLAPLVLVGTPIAHAIVAMIVCHNLDDAALSGAFAWSQVWQWAVMVFVAGSWAPPGLSKSYGVGLLIGYAAGGAVGFALRLSPLGMDSPEGGPETRVKTEQDLERLQRALKVSLPVGSLLRSWPVPLAVVHVHGRMESRWSAVADALLRRSAIAVMVLRRIRDSPSLRSEAEMCRTLGVPTLFITRCPRPSGGLEFPPRSVGFSPDADRRGSRQA